MNRNKVDPLDRLSKKRVKGTEEQKEEREVKKKKLIHSSGINASSFLALKADLAKSKSTIQTDTSKSAPADKALPLHLRSIPLSSSSSSSAKRTSKKQRNTSGTSTSSWASTPSANLDAVRANLERKARIYEALKAGKQGGVSEAMYAEGLVDWQRKAEEEETEEEEEEESQASNEDGIGSEDKAEDSMVLYEDEFGRSRLLPRSEVPREWLRQKEREEQERGESSATSDVIYGPSTSFPVYRPPSPVLSAKAALAQQSAAPARFDSTAEVRNRGAGFYAFSRDEGARAEQMSALEAEHRKTEMLRLEKGAAAEAVDRREERRREVERKRKELVDKRRKKAA